MNHQPIQAVLFDLGSTLIYFDTAWNSVTAAYNQALVDALHQAGIPVDPAAFPLEFEQQMDAYFDKRDSETVEYTTAFILSTLLEEHGYLNISDEIIAGVLRRLYATTQAHWHSEADTLATLTLLRRQGYRLAVVSNAGDDADVQALVDKAGIRPLLDAVVTSAAVGIRKPDPRIFHVALDRIGVPASRAVMVGDLLGADILGAHNLGIPGIWIDRRADEDENRNHVEAIHPDAVISDLASLPALLDRWNRERRS